ncbi:hypothetical protein [Mesoplasma melaleucae]|uniref:Methyltransferase n=1 Tax=Mesoplasma melaleucae TaxID=81459 RepID=A0A2K8NW16_9MOLU|nr:hypothetical protein [Mesoplasma melaleucae]ATZ17957.1 methyltransferase [Mesoplasma melaleucae]
MLIFTIGAITWFKDINELFKIVSKCLKRDGILILHDYYPLTNMLPFPGEAKYNENLTIIFESRYFSDEPWIENNGM